MHVGRTDREHEHEQQGFPFVSLSGLTKRPAVEGTQNPIAVPNKDHWAQLGGPMAGFALAIGLTKERSISFRAQSWQLRSVALAGFIRVEVR